MSWSQTLESLFAAPAFGLPRAQKEQTLLALLGELTEFHRTHNPDYARLLERLPTSGDGLSGLPFIPVGLFKERVLRSVPESEVFKTLLSSGTTSGHTSRVVLDRETAQLQTKALASIMTHFLGPKRRPMLIIDTPDVIKNRLEFSARGAGILGMMNFGFDALYALNTDLTLNVPAVEAWLEKHRGTPLFIFGFTSLVWQHFVQSVGPKKWNLEKSVLVHGGGWKKLEAQAVSPAAFRAACVERLNLTLVHSYYGMVEQVGSVYVECERGNLHAPNFGDVEMVDPLTWKPVPDGTQGLVKVFSVLPRSYPGHVILTEDLGTRFTADGCECGRHGSAFHIHGRLPKAQLRGCSDTTTPVRVAS